jgi:hypothetical protein
MIGAAKLDVATYEEVEADRGATKQAMLVVVLSALAAAVGGIGHDGARGPLLGLGSALIGWYLWALVTWLIGTKILREPQTEADLGQLLRTTGFSAAPGLLRVAGFIPGVGGLVTAAAALWMLVAMVVAVRQALDYRGTGRAVAVVVIGFLFYLAVVVGLGFAFGVPLMMMGAAGR